MFDSSGKGNDNGKDDGTIPLSLIIMFGTHFCFFLLTYFWLYPADETPKTAVMYKLETDVKKSVITGEPTVPTAHLSIREISFLCRRGPCQERTYQLSEDDQKTLIAVKDGETNYLKNGAQLFDDLKMNYGSLIVKRGHAVLMELSKETKEQIDNDEAALVEDLIPLRRPKAELDKRKKRKTKERMDALNQLTRAESAERVPLLSRILPVVSSTMLKERTLELHSTVEEEKTMQRVVRKPAANVPYQKMPIVDANGKRKASTTKEGLRTAELVSAAEDDKTLQKVARMPSSARPHKKPSNVEVNVKKKKSATAKEVSTAADDDKTMQRLMRYPSSNKPYRKASTVEINLKRKKSAISKSGATTREDPSLAPTVEETQRNIAKKVSRENFGK